MQNSSNDPLTENADPPDQTSGFKLGNRVHWVGDCRRIGTIRYVGSVAGYSGQWVGVDWDNGDGKHDGSVNGVQYFQAKSERSASFARPHNLRTGVTVIEALHLRYQGESAKEEEEEMYVLSSSKMRVSIQLVGKDKVQNKFKHFDELESASTPFLGVSTPGPSGQIGSVIPNLKMLDLTGNLLSEWKDIGAICLELPRLSTLNVSYNAMKHEVKDLPVLKSIRVLVLNCTGIKWLQVESLGQFFPAIEELHVMGNNINEITTLSSDTVQGFQSLRLLNLEENCLSNWEEIVKLSKLPSLAHLYLNKNNLNRIFYPRDKSIDEASNSLPFQNLQCFLLGANKIEDLQSIDSLNSFPGLRDIRLTGNPVADAGRGGVPRFVLVARLATIEVLNGSEVSTRERKESEIRYVRLVMSKMHDQPEDIKKQHPRFFELKKLHGIEDGAPPSRQTGPQKMASNLLSITLKCVGPSIGEKPPLTKKLPPTTTVGKLKTLCEAFFKLRSMKLKLFLEEMGSPLPLLLDDDMVSLLEGGIGNESTVLVDEDN